MSTVKQNLCLSLKEFVVRIVNFLKDAAAAQTADKSCLQKKLEDLAFDVDNILDDLNNIIQINQNKLIIPENYLNVAEIIANGDPIHEVDTESKTEKYGWTSAENYLSKNNHGKLLSYDHDPYYRVDTVNHIHKYKGEMAAELIAGVKLLLGKVAPSPIMTELALLWNLEGELENLKRSAKMIESLLDDIAETKQASGKSTRDWLQDLEVVALDAKYVFEVLSYQLVRSKVQEISGCTDFLTISNNQIINRHTAATKVKDISQRLKALYEMRNGLNPPMRSSAYNARGGGGPASTHYVNCGAFVGRESDVRKLADMVCGGAAREQRLSVLPIVGMGGVGKTALAETVCNDERVVSHFGERIWVTVSEDFNVDSLFNNLLAPLMMPGENYTPGFFQRREVLRRIREKLMHKTYLLVLDDVWNEHRLAWKEFFTSLEGVSFGRGNVVLLTTRKENVVHTLTRNPPLLCAHSLGLLSDEDCWFVIKAVTNFDTNPDSELEAIGKSIAARCGGLPLAAHVVADFLGGRSKEEWVSIRSNWILDLDMSSISTILKRSVDNLSSAAHKKCFAYCSIIPKGSCIDKDNLIELWMAEGLLQADKKSDMEGAGNNILNDLVHSSLIQVLERDSLTGDAKKVVTHPLVADLALSLLQPDLLDDDDHQCRYIFSESARHFQIEKHADNLCALFFYSELSDKMLSRLKRLHTLILNGEDIKELPVSIGELIHLKYLNIANTRIETLPESIGYLHLFQTLRATKQHGEKNYLRELPETFKYLLSLRHLHIPSIELPPGVGSLTSLRTLPYFCVSDEEGRRIAELGNLTNLRGELEIDNLGKVRDKEEAESANLIINPNIYMLKLAWKNEGGQSSNDDMNVLEGLQPHPNLKILEILGFRGKSFPSWTMKMAVRKELMLSRLDNLIRLKLSNCMECEEVPMLGQLPHLKCLLLSHLTNLKAIGSSFYGNESSVFPQLQRLELMGLKNLRVWEEVNSSSSSSSVSIFPRLEVLVITQCYQLESAPSEFPCLKEFKVVSMESPLPVANICGAKLSTLRKLEICEVRGLVCLSDGLFSRNRDLSEATILDCWSLTSLRNCGASSSLRRLVVKYCNSLTEFADVGSLDALEDLVIEVCPKLRPIPYSSSGPSKLRSLNISSCNNGLTIKMMQSCAPSLERFRMKRCENSIAQHVMLVKIIEEKMPHLTTLGYELPRVMDETFLFPALQSLSKLMLIGAGANAIPESLCHFTALHGLVLEEFGIEALPDWLGSLPSLQLLCISECPKLRCLPSHNTNLEQLYITKCPLLTKALVMEPRNLNPEWSKISHIPYIQFDYNQITQHGPATPVFEIIDICERG